MGWHTTSQINQEFVTFSKIGNCSFIDVPMMLNLGKFEYNGKCGLVKSARADIFLFM